MAWNGPQIDPTRRTPASVVGVAEDPVAAAMRNVYWWMTVGLSLTAITALLVARSEALVGWIYGHPLVAIGLLVLEVVCVLVIAAGMRRLSGTTLTALFLGYSVLNGLTFSILFLVYTAGSVALTFFVTAGTFASMAVYGTVTRRDLSSWGSFLFMGLIGLILASVANYFLQSEMLYWGVTYAAVLVFVGLTAYDVQKFRRMAEEGLLADERIHIFCALALYLDFINLFLHLLRVLGSRR